ncbi:hypothetical protein [Sphingomonas sp. VDB2]|uniref:hypothetical protein n=1 Tax=Sphingomonas sp. VDB2 TaxID=3228751 RepID=UPI003A807629
MRIAYAIYVTMDGESRQSQKSFGLFGNPEIKSILLQYFTTENGIAMSQKLNARPQIE